MNNKNLLSNVNEKEFQLVLSMPNVTINDKIKKIEKLILKIYKDFDKKKLLYKDNNIIEKELAIIKDKLLKIVDSIEIIKNSNKKELLRLVILNETNKITNKMELNNEIFKDTKNKNIKKDYKNKDNNILKTDIKNYHLYNWNKVNMMYGSTVETIMKKRFNIDK